ncbi:fla cluster protein FlaF [Halobacterium litoreum]|uniref:Fla cluster protein FlaF n=1 Tax=Halobacterium litoreum TaxID=2039234 RepID=A0ABD5N9P7_9EURY|nr:fla cluster protein FlaF [Halobacterium litoreum]UHH12023.1 fla cluster protein FlaF [Halobacterium litoreum]
MGFSVSGSAAILFIAAFVSVGILYSAAFNGYERVQDADDRHGERVLERRNTVVDVTNVTYNTTSDELTVNVTNSGATSLSVNETDLLLDGEFRSRSGYDSWSVGGQTDTTLWLPGETYSVTVTTASQPDRVKVVTSSGVAATEVV